MKLFIFCFFIIHIAVGSSDKTHSTSWNYDSPVSINTFRDREDYIETLVGSEIVERDTEEMVDAYGRKYTCELPYHEAEEDDINTYIPLLELKDECASVTYLSYTYEVCIMNQVRKLKKDGSEKVGEILGKYNRSLSKPYNQTYISSTTNISVVFTCPDIDSQQLKKTPNTNTLSILRIYINKNNNNSKIDYLQSITTPKISTIHFNDANHLEFNITTLRACSNYSNLSIIFSELMNYTCISKSEGWWSYTVCPGGKIYQYHSSKGKSDYSEYILGEYNLNKNIEMNEKNESFVESDNTKTKDPSKIAYYKEVYENGTECDISNLNRRTALLYSCKADGESSIMSITELKSCEYQIIVGSPIICYHPLMVNINDLNNPKKRDSVINCYPKS